MTVTEEAVGSAHFKEKTLAEARAEVLAFEQEDPEYARAMKTIRREWAVLHQFNGRVDDGSVIPHRHDQHIETGTTNSNQ